MRKLLISCILLFSLGLFVDHASAKEFEKREFVDPFKTWRISFNDNLDASTIDSHVSILNQNGDALDVQIEQGYEHEIIVSPPKTGYEIGHTYQLIISKEIKAVNGRSMSEDTSMIFTIRPDGYSTKNKDGDYIKVQSISPSGKQTIMSDDFIIEIVLEYGLYSAESASISFDLFAPFKSFYSVDGTLWTLDSSSISKGTGTITLRGAIQPEDYETLLYKFYNQELYPSITMDHYTWPRSKYLEMILPNEQYRLEDQSQ